MPLPVGPAPIVPLPPDNSGNGFQLTIDDDAAVLEQVVLPPQSQRRAAAKQQQAAPQRLGQAAGREGQREQAPVVLIARPLPRVLLIHCGGTLGMDAAASYELDLEGHMMLKPVGAPGRGCCRCCGQLAAGLRRVCRSLLQLLRDRVATVD